MERKRVNLFGLTIDNPKTPRNLLLIVFSLWVISILLMMFLNDQSTRGQVGDMFGAINSLFSGLAFAGIIYTILLQSEELGAQREELKLNREEAKLARIEFEQQNRTLARQNFESTFFSLLSAQRDSLKTITSKFYEGKTGSAILRKLADKLVEAVITKHTPAWKQEDYHQVYLNIIGVEGVYLNEYLWTLNSLLHYIESNELPQDAKNMYHGIIASRMSIDELEFLEFHHSYTSGSASSRLRTFLLDSDYTLRHT